MANTCHTGLAPTPGSAKVLVGRIGTVLACVSPAALTTVPMTASTPSASSWAIAAAASGGAVTRGGSGPAGQGECAALRDIQGPQHPSHAQPQRTRQRQVGEQLLGELLAAAGPEVLVVAQHRVFGGESVRELGGQPLLHGLTRPGAPLQGMLVQLFVDAGRGPVGVPSVDAYRAFVVVGDHDSREFTRAQRQPTVVVNRVAESGDRTAEVRGFVDPAGQVVVSECSDSAHGEMVRPVSTGGSFSVATPAGSRRSSGQTRCVTIRRAMRSSAASI